MAMCERRGSSFVMVFCGNSTSRPLGIASRRHRLSEKSPRMLSRAFQPRPQTWDYSARGERRAQKHPNSKGLFTHFIAHIESAKKKILFRANFLTVASTLEDCGIKLVFGCPHPYTAECFPRRIKRVAQFCIHPA